MSYVTPSAPLSIWGVVGEWLRIFRISFRRCWMLPLVMVPITAWIQFSLLPPGASHPSPGAPFPTALVHVEAVLESPRLIVSQLLFMVTSSVLICVLMAQQIATLRGSGANSFGSALFIGLRRLPRTSLALLLLIFTFAAASGAMLFSVASLIELAAVPTTALALRVVYAIGIPAVVIGVLMLIAYLWMALGLTFAAVYVDDCGAVASLGRTWRLVKGHWWRVVKFGLISMIILWLVAITFTSVIRLFVAHALVLADAYSHRVVIVGASACNALAFPLTTAAELAIYYDLRSRLQESDVSLREDARA